jgi:multimeric flavodoxin WrbA
MKVLVLFGSPRKKGNTIQLVNAFSKILKDKGHSMKVLYLNDMNLRPCQGCYACLKEGICRINDDMKDIRKFIAESDLIVYATPIYWFGPSGQLKLVMDRSIAFMDEEYNSRIKGKKAVTLMTFASDEKDTCQPALDMFKKTFDLLGLKYAGSVEVPACADPPVALKKTYIDKTTKLARSLA